MSDTQLGGFTVDERHRMEADCPACGTHVDVYHLGLTTINGDLVEGWVCGECESELREHDPQSRTKNLTEVKP